ncbi:MAG: cupin domain-containing protein [Bacteroidales bacterium]|nr:cupin domain-containing protein [Bacteroidales bacterium]
MITVKREEGTPYEAPQHEGVYGVIKLTKEQTKQTVISYSYFLPNGYAEMSSAPVNRIYMVVKGSVTVTGKSPDEVHTADKGDLVYIEAGEEREIRVNNGQPAEVMVIVVES